MEKFKKISAAVLAITMLSGVMTACGDTADDEDSSASTSSAATSSEDASSEEESSEDESTAEEETGYYTPQYEFDGYDAYLMFADSSWLWGNWKPTGYVHSTEWEESGGDDATLYGYGVDADITGDGEYTVAITKESIVGNETYVNPNLSLDGNVPAMGASGAVVFCIDIVGLMDGSEVTGLDDDGNWVNEAADETSLVDGDNHYNTDTIGDYAASEITCEVTSIKCDGVEVSFDASKILCGNIEDNTNSYRIEIYNDYGNTLLDSPFDNVLSDIAFEESLEVTFTITGLGEVKTFAEVTPFGDDSADTETTEEDSTEEEAEESTEEDAE
ncbi:MAG: hypothetical protein LUE12_08380 [Ruminococcus sp.]|nr:hypothetical protein [Ruminococcus sp.]